VTWPGHPLLPTESDAMPRLRLVELALVRIGASCATSDKHCIAVHTRCLDLRVAAAAASLPWMARETMSLWERLCDRGDGDGIAGDKSSHSRRAECGRDEEADGRAECGRDEEADGRAECDRDEEADGACNPESKIRAGRRDSSRLDCLADQFLRECAAFTMSSSGTSDGGKLIGQWDHLREAVSSACVERAEAVSSACVERAGGGDDNVDEDGPKEGDGAALMRLSSAGAGACCVLFDRNAISGTGMHATVSVQTKIGMSIGRGLLRDGMAWMQAQSTVSSGSDNDDPATVTATVTATDTAASTGEKRQR